VLGSVEEKIDAINEDDFSFVFDVSGGENYPELKSTKNVTA